MNKKKLVSLLGMAATLALVGFAEKNEAAEMHRLYNHNNGEHFYTENVAEKNSLTNSGWKYEGIGWIAPDNGDVVHRLYNPNSGEHHFTLNMLESEALQKSGWKYEGKGFYSSKGKEVPIYRVFNPNAKGADSHHYTLNTNERNALVSVGWKNEGIGWYGIREENSNGGNAGNNGNEEENENNQGNEGNSEGNQGNTDGEFSNIEYGENIWNAVEPTLDEINKYRREKGLPEYELDEELTKAAMLRSKELITKYSHTRPDGSKFSTAYTGETTLVSFAEVVTSSRLPNTAQELAVASLNKFKLSTEHNAIILNEKANRDKIGIGFVKKKADQNDPSERGVDAVYYTSWIFARTW